MVWNTIAHPKMMRIEPDPGGGSVITFSKEALESPIKYMNRDLLATFDYIIWERRTSDSVSEANKFSKITLLTGNFESLFVAGKNKTIVNGLWISSELEIRPNPDTGAAEYYPIENDDGTNCHVRQLQLITPMCLYGKMTMRDHKFDFGKDSFVTMPETGSNPFILISQSEEVLIDNEAITEAMKYAVNEESDKA